MAKTRKRLRPKPRQRARGPISRHAYEKACLLAEIAERDLKSRIAAVLRSLGDPNLVRAGLAESRIKSLYRLRRKAKANGWKNDDGLEKATDFVGLRVVCNNFQDVSRAADLIQDTLVEHQIRVKRQDYLASPGPGGYRAIHLDVQVPVRLYANQLTIGCEIQIRSFLQDAWARLSHADLYGQNFSPPKDLLRKMERLADQLSKADKEADAIRNQISRPRKGRKSAPGSKLNKPSIAFLYRRAFGESPPDYLTEIALEEFSSTDLRTDGLDSALKNQRLISQIKTAYQKEMPYDPSNTELFLWIVTALSRNKSAAIREARDAGKRDWDEVDAIYRRETLSSLPETIDELIKQLAHHETYLDVEGWATALSATGECAICGAAFIHPDALTEALLDYYDVPEEDVEDLSMKIEETISNCGAEVADWENPSLCSYHAHVLSKDD